MLIVLADNESGLSAVQQYIHTGLPEAEVISVAGLKAGEELAVRRRATVLVIGPSIPADRALEAATRLVAEQIGTVIVCRNLTTELLRRAMRTGVRDVVCTNDPPDEIGAVIRQVALTQPAAEDGASEPEVARQGQITAVFSTKGGVGKSTVATNLATAMVKEGKDTILVDLDLQFGDVAIMLQLVPERTIYDVTRVIDRLDHELLSGFLTTHQSGLKTLLAPIQPEHAESVTGPRIRKILEMLSTMAECVIVDTPAAFNDAVLTALDCSDQILAVATMDVPSIKNMRVSLQKLKQLGYDESCVHLVLNRADSKVWLQVAEVEKALEDKIAAQIPSDRLVPRSVNKGVPVVLEEPRSSVARSFFELTRYVQRQNKGVAKDVA